MSAGKMRRMRRAYNSKASKESRSRSSSKIRPEMRKPEMTKNTSTPANPPGIHRGRRMKPDHREDGGRTQPVDVAAIGEAMGLGWSGYRNHRIQTARAPAGTNASITGSVAHRWRISMNINA